MAEHQKEKHKTTKSSVTTVMKELKIIGSEQTKRTYMRHGAREPLYGITTKDLKILKKKIGNDYHLSMELYASGNYDAMYFAGMISESRKMSRADFESWIKAAYCPGLSSHTVAVTLAETAFAQAVADAWMQSPQDIYRTAGWSCYCQLLACLADSCFREEKIKTMLHVIKDTIHGEANDVKYAMNSFVIAVGISYIPLHEYALDIAIAVGFVDIDMGNTNCKTPCAEAYIKKAVDTHRIGYKRKHVRCF